jgi:hypothetical protein
LKARRVVQNGWCNERRSAGCYSSDLFLSFTALSLAEVLRAIRHIRLGIENNGLLLTTANEKLDRLNDKLGSVSERAPDRSAGFDPPKLVNENFDKETQEIKSLLGKLASGLAEIKAGTRKRAAQ